MTEVPNIESSPVPPGGLRVESPPPPELAILILLKGEVNPRPCSWPQDDFRALADLDHAVGGVSNFDLALLRHVAAVLWVSSARDLTFEDFQDRLSASPESIDKMRRGAVMLWQQIM